MKRQSLFSMTLLWVQTVTVCYGQTVEQKSPAEVHKNSATVSAYENWVKSNEYAEDKVKKAHQDDQNKKAPVFPEDMPSYVDSYYDRMLVQASERRWAVPLTFDYSFQSQAFDACGNKVGLASSLFGSGTRIRDIFLLARLSAEGKLHIHPRGFEPPNPQFGNNPDQQYLNLLAPMHVGLTATQYSSTLGFNALYRWRPMDDVRLFCIFGLDLPVHIQKKTLDLAFQDGTLFKAGYVSNATNRENVLTQFFKDWSSVEDFFLRGVLGSKGISFLPSQQVIGLGDISLSANCEFGPFYKESARGECYGVDFGQVGISVGFPSGKKASANDLWGTEFGNGGGYQYTLFGTCNTRSVFSFLNPSFNAGIELHSWACRSGTSGLRVPRTVTAAEEMRVLDVPDLVAPVFKEFLTDAFSEQDTTVAAFADSVANASVKVGRRVFVGVGNYFYDFLNSRFRLGVFYTYSSKKADAVCVQEKKYDTSLLQYPSTSHRLSWKMSYKFKNLVELGFGTQHILGGKSVPEQHDIFFSLAAAF